MHSAQWKTVLIHKSSAQHSCLWNVVLYRLQNSADDYRSPPFIEQSPIWATFFSVVVDVLFALILYSVAHLPCIVCVYGHNNYLLLYHRFLGILVACIICLYIFIAHETKLIRYAIVNVVLNYSQPQSSAIVACICTSLGEKERETHQQTVSLD